MSDTDDDFYTRADAHIHLSNDQLSEAATRGKVSASMMYATARFNAWITACGHANAEEMTDARAETLDYFVAEYRKMLAEHLDDYTRNFDRYMNRTS